MVAQISGFALFTFGFSLPACILDVDEMTILQNSGICSWPNDPTPACLLASPTESK